MGVPSTSTPPAGSIGVGELRADAQSRTLWLGVPGSIDPAQSLLVSDIVGLQEEIVDGDAALAASLTSGLAGKANTSHIHAISDVTGLQDALDENAGGLPSGCIVLWSGTIGTIPGGWTLCNGQNGTPDLRDRFVLGAGGSIGSALATGGARVKTVTSDSAGGVTPTGTIGDTTLTTAQIPAHTHVATQAAHNHTITDPGHDHGIAVRANARMDSVSAVYTTTAGGGTGADSTGVADATTGITINNATPAITVQNAGSGGSHSHSLVMAAIGAHSHSISVDVLPPYIILGYIMKV